MAVTPHEGTICQHFQRAAELVGQRWVPQVIYVLVSGPARYTAIHDAIPGISDAMLSDRLKDLEAERIITRDVEPTSPVRISYATDGARRRAGRRPRRAAGLGRTLGDTPDVRLADAVSGGPEPPAQPRSRYGRYDRSRIPTFSFG